jgi:lysophospholipase L1-like esterase
LKLPGHGTTFGAVKTLGTLFSLLLVCALEDSFAQTIALTNPPASAAAVRTNTAIIPAPRAQEGPQKRYAELNQRVKAAAGNVDLVFLGDSITQGWEGNGKNVWKKYYGERKALNIGIGGDRTQHVLWRLDNGNFEGIKPKVVVLMIGTNNSNRDDHPAGEIHEGVVAIVRRLQELSPDTKVLLVGIFPRGQNFNDQRGKILQVNQALAKLDDGKRVFYVDFGSRLIERDGSISKAIMPDYLHLSEAGYRIWAEAIEPKLAELLGVNPIAPEASVAGEWTWQMKGPNGEDVQGPLLIQVDGGKVTGEFRTEGGRAMKIRSGTFSGSKLQLIVPRERPQGGEMVYEMEGTVDGDRISGEAVAEMNGQKVRAPWTATRK